MNLSKDYAEELIKEYADNDPDFLGAEGMDNKFSIWNYTFLLPPSFKPCSDRTCRNRKNGRPLRFSQKSKGEKSRSYIKNRCPIHESKNRYTDP